MIESLATDRTLVMGVVNVTPDSFSDGGRWFDADEELRRVLPVVQGLVAEGVIVSVDTMRATIAERALGAGAQLLNDVSGGRADPAMLPLAAASDVPIVLMHWREHSAGMQNNTHYDDVVADVGAELALQVEAALAAGIDRSRLVVDPGLGFSKTGDQNWTVLAHLDAFMALGLPLLVAASRKRFLGELLADETGLRPTGEREAATAAVTMLAALAGAWCVRVHDPAASADVVRVAARLRVEPT